MAVDERARHELHERLVEVLGDDRASTLMSYLPPVGWADVATKADLDNLAALAQRDLAAARAELREEIGGLRSDLERFRVDHDRRFAEAEHERQQLGRQLRLELHQELGALRTQMHADLSRLSRTFFLGLVGANATLAAVAFAAGSLS